MRGAICGSRAALYEGGFLLRMTQDTTCGGMRTPSRNKFAKRERQIQNVSSVLLIAISFMREEFESVRSTKS